MFDEQNIILSFGAVSDIHIGNSGCGRDCSYFQKALKQLAEAAQESGHPLDAVIGVGDMTDHYGDNDEKKLGEIASLKESYEAILNPETVPFVYVMGNHDHGVKPDGSRIGFSLQTFLEKTGNIPAYTQYDLPCDDFNNGSRHAKIGSYHFLFVEPLTYACEIADDSGVKFALETLTWLDKTLESITAKEPEKYIFIMSHAMIYGTAYGSELVTRGTYWYTKNIIPVLEKYPQAVVFGGHLHFPLNDPRSIMQTKFTALGCGSVNYMAIENGGYEHMLSPCITEDRLEFSQGLLCQLDTAGNLRMTRMDFRHNTTIGTPWTLPCPSADGSHLQIYSKDRAAQNTAPVLSDIHISFGEKTEEGTEIFLHFHAACDDEFAHHYIIEVLQNGEILKTMKILSDFYLHGNPANMKNSFTEPLGSYSSGTYHITLQAVDSWNAVSQKVTANFDIK